MDDEQNYKTSLYNLSNKFLPIDPIRLGYLTTFEWEIENRLIRTFGQISEYDYIYVDDYV